MFWPWWLKIVSDTVWSWRPTREVFKECRTCGLGPRRSETPWLGDCYLSKRKLSTHYRILVSSVLVVCVYETFFFYPLFMFDQVLALYLWFCCPSLLPHFLSPRVFSCHFQRPLRSHKNLATIIGVNKQAMCGKDGVQYLLHPTSPPSLTVHGFLPSSSQFLLLCLC